MWPTIEIKQKLFMQDTPLLLRICCRRLVKAYDIILYIIYVKRRTEITAAGRDRERSPSPRPADSKYIKKHKSSHINNAADTDNQTHTVSINAASREAHKKVSKHFTPFHSSSPSTLS